MTLTKTRFASFEASLTSIGLTGFGSSFSITSDKNLGGLHKMQEAHF